jgi:NH3-dependent NAD+ synthetase
MLETVVESLRQLYLADARPWMVGFSGGKDSTLVAHLVFDAVRSVPANDRIKEIHILCTNTRVEIPAVVEGAGVPLSAFITGANTHEVTKVESTLNSKVAHQQVDGNEIDENLCADADFVGAQERIEAFGYIPHIRPRNVEAELIKNSPDFKPRRWVVETFFS